MKKQTKLKIIVLLISVVLALLAVVGYFVDPDVVWSAEVIVSAIMVPLWIFFIPETLVYYYFKIKNSGLEYSVGLGIVIGAGGFIGIFIAPYYGVKFFISDLDSLRYNGEFFL